MRADEPSSCVAGPFGSNIGKKYFVDDGVPVIRGSNLTDDRTRFVPAGFAFVSRDRAKSYVPQHVVGGDLVFTCWGTIGQVGLIPEDGPYPAYVISNKQLKLRPNHDVADPLFLFYYFASDQMVQFIRTRAIGAAVPGINLGILKSLPVVLPPVSIQRKIVAVLGAYDELIENNLRRIKILEEMAQAIYREWFVNFRFPGHEDVALVDSPLGPIPEGWKVVPLSDVASVNSESIRPKYAPAEIRYIDISSVSPGSIDAVTHVRTQDAPSRARRVVRHGDTIWSTVRPNRRSFAVVLNPAENTIASTGFAVLRPVRVPWAFLHLATSTMEFSAYLSNHARGAAYPAVNAEDFENAQVLFPRAEVLERFAPVVEPMFELRENLTRQNTNLRATRDLLLPKLVSGEIDVSELDIDTDWLAS